MTITHPTFGRVEITEKDLTAPTSLSFDCYNHFHVLCLHALYTSGIPVVDDKFLSLAPGQIDEVYRQIRIDPRCFQFGRFAVIILAPQFVDRFTRALHYQGRKVEHHLVHYYDDITFNGAIPRNQILFWKQKRFAYQREYRFAVAPRLWGNDPLIVDIGDISQICGMVPSHKLNDLVRLNTEQAV
jgi:hypothetical protein